MQELLNEKKIIAILRKVPFDKLQQVMQAMYDGGIRFAEITFDQASDTCIEDTTKAIAWTAENFPDMYVGAGTVMTVEQCEAAFRAGVRYIISPDVNPDVITKTVELGMLSIPGAFTPSEIAEAYRLGAAYVKVCPAGNLGPGYVKAIRGPISHIPLFAVGGVELDNMEAFAKAGICGFGIGGNIIKKDLIEQNRFEELTELARKYVELAERL